MTLSDIQAVADLTAKFLGLIIRPKARITKARRGHAWTNKGTFTIPEWAVKRGEDYATYYTSMRCATSTLAGFSTAPFSRRSKIAPLQIGGFTSNAKKYILREYSKAQ